MSKTEPFCWAAFGARSTGKTSWVKKQIAQLKPPRLMVWDFKNDPSLDGLGKAYKSLPDFIKSLKEKSFQSRYLVNHSGDIHQQFNLFCMAAWQAGCLVMFVDELPEVTKANKAPAAWRRCVNIGREYQDEKTGQKKWLSIIGAGQRPAECDKSFIGNTDLVHTGRLSHASDARELADSLGCNFRELLVLPNLHWIERRAGQVEPERGVLTFSKNISKLATAKKPALRARS